MQGGAILSQYDPNYIQRGAILILILTIRDSNFTSNTAVVDGGAVSISSDGATATNISATNFSDNKALNGAGGAVLLAASKLEAAVQGCRFENNQAATTGGALSVEQLVPNAPGNLKVGCQDSDGRDCTSSTSTGYMQCFASINASNGTMFREYEHASQPVVIESSDFFGNRASDKQQGIAGALHLANINATVTYCGLATNFAAVDGGAVYLLGGSGSLALHGSTTYLSSNMAAGTGSAIHSSSKGSITLGGGTLVDIQQGHRQCHP